MTHHQIHDLVRNGIFPEHSGSAELVETHANWIILTETHAWKIKKPVHLNFLDYSTLGKRKFYCQQEVELNRRLTDIYLGAVPIHFNGEKFGVKIPGEIMDYAVKMKRLEAARQMHLLLQNDQVKIADVEAIAEIVADFHHRAKTVSRPFDEQATAADFADIQSVVPLLAGQVNAILEKEIAAWVDLAKAFLAKTSARFQQRIEAGMVRDGHGDLHSGNIFLLEKPVIFDCIEFSAHFRENDILSETAFLCMDLERHGRQDLAKAFLKKYTALFPCINGREDEAIFQYFLLYRASVRLKISALRLQGKLAGGEKDCSEEMREIRQLEQLCRRYAQALAAAF